MDELCLLFECTHGPAQMMRNWWSDVGTRRPSCSAHTLWGTHGRSTPCWYGELRISDVVASDEYVCVYKIQITLEARESRPANFTHVPHHFTRPPVASSSDCAVEAFRSEGRVLVRLIHFFFSFFKKHLPCLRWRFYLQETPSLWYKQLLRYAIKLVNSELA